MDFTKKWKSTFQPYTLGVLKSIESEITIQRKLGKTIYPPNNQIFNALKYVDPDNCKVVILGQDPYHEPNQANGLAFSVNDGTQFPPSLRNIYKELSSDLSLPMPTTGDLTPWAKQGVLLLNTSLTVEQGKANSHADLGWDEVVKPILTHIMMSHNFTVFLCWGKYAHNTVSDILQTLPESVYKYNRVLASTHPSPLSALRPTKDFCAFIGSKPFSQTNQALIEHNETPIDWRLP